MRKLVISCHCITKQASQIPPILRIERDFSIPAVQL
jgi:hypothetical protein